MSTAMTPAQAAAVRAALTETWCLYGFGTLAIILRTISRVHIVGVRGFDFDDYAIWFGWACYTIMTVAAHEVTTLGGDTSYLSPEERLSMSPEMAAMRQQGTQWFMVGWYTYIGLIWTLKLNMLFLYRRVVGFIFVRKLIMPTIIFVGVTGMAIWILLSTACRPFNHLWQITPDPGPTCFPQSHVFLITILTFNLATDICIILIPIPIIMPLRISLERKIGLLVLFCAGIFIMAAAILRVYFVLAQRAGGTAAIWSCREDFVAVVLGQATFLRPMAARRFWSSQPTSSYAGKDAPNSQELRTIGQSSTRNGFSRFKDPAHISLSGSEEFIVRDEKLEKRNESEELGSRGKGGAFERVIHVQRSIVVEEGETNRRSLIMGYRPTISGQALYE